MIVSLNTVPVGKTCSVENLNFVGEKRRRMLDLGLIKDTEIEVLHKSPFGDPVAYFFKGTIIALRKEDAEQILVR